ncbi:autotransporter domain-containing esterase [Pseudoxanthomonas dokdonensis]|uniref:Esterase n=1 Tax=Pseudoxanthomonas dokdonensis TaxID=344882 RepID=A0A0R0CWK9_9GAMM|nr:autotransporter domain-containing esterase [Pseudoxanthomonas dokdonensis]KRG70100.1 esterase [Pseudoxanthomonas dokdonensis]
MKMQKRPMRHVLALALAVAAAPAVAQSSPFSNTVFFGDSLTDAGAFRPGLIQVGGPGAAIVGRFSTNPGLVWAEFLADQYGTNATPVNQGGDNYAVGGARLDVDRSSPFGTVPSVASQVGNYLAANGGSADPNALYTVWGGANDLFAVAAGEETPATIVNAVTTEIGVVAGLQQAGARYVLVPNIPNLGITPQFRAQGAAGMAGGTQLATAYNDALYGGLAQAGLRVIPLDTFGFLGEIIASPAEYGFSNVTGTACNIESSLTCSPADYVTPDAAESYVFADGVHPTTAAHRMLAEYAQSILEAPRQNAVLAYTATLVGRARADRVAAHVGQAPEADGMRWWGDLRADTPRYDEGDFDGTSPAGTFGIDWARGAWVFGGFGGYGKANMDFGGRGGSFDESDATLGGFAGWYGERAWVNGQLSYTWLSYDVDRNVHLGPATRTHSGSADGSNLTAALNAGYEFGEGSFRHGPVASVVSQTVELDGYSENNSSATALSYPDQDWDSLIGSIGWQMSIQANDHVRPYARFTFDHEFEDAPAEAFAQLQSVPGLVPYAVPGLQVDQDFGTMMVGVRTRLFGLDADIGATATVEQKGGNNATLFATLSGGF